MNKKTVKLRYNFCASDTFTQTSIYFNNKSNFIINAFFHKGSLAGYPEQLPPLPTYKVDPKYK